MNIHEIVEAQHRFFNTGATLPVSFRKAMLQKLRDEVDRHEGALAEALAADLGKSGYEGFMCEIGLVRSELSYMLRHTARLARERTVRTPLAQFAARSFQKPSPYGSALIMSPWNYPVLLTLDPLADAIAAGNTAVVKPSAYAPAVSALLAELIGRCFPPEYVAAVTGGREENAALLEEAFDFVFFTGSQAVGREVLRHTAERLTPAVLELGGKSPCIVDETARLPLAARRIVFGKYLNCGQTCVAPDYIYCDRSVKEQFIKEVKKQIQKQYGKQPLSCENYGKIINEKHFDRIRGLIDPEKVVCGGHTNRAKLQIDPTVLDNVTFADAIMQEEIFGPLMPVLTYDSLDEVIRNINSMPHPLALYIFTNDHAAAEKITSRCGFGGGCINDTIIHLATSEMGFGGFGASGMGSYHGKAGFDTFTHYKSMVDKKTWLDLPMRYQPYKKQNEKLLRMFLK